MTDRTPLRPYLPAWRVAAVHWLAALLGIHIEIMGKRFGSNRLMRAYINRRIAADYDWFNQKNKEITSDDSSDKHQADEGRAASH